MPPPPPSTEALRAAELIQRTQCGVRCVERTQRHIGALATGQQELSPIAQTGEIGVCHALPMLALRTDEPPRRAPAIWRTMLNIDRGLVNLVGRLTVTGRVPAQLRGRPLLMAANHIGVFDAFVLMAACKRIGINPRFMLAGGILDAPVIGPALRVSGHLRVDRKHASTAVGQFAEAVEALKTTREPLIVYPEGRI